MTTKTGGCACGAVRYELTADPLFQFACHCHACQHSNGGAPTYGMIVPKPGVHITQGELTTYWSDSESGGKVGRQFCPTCGSPLFSIIDAMPAVLGVKVGGLDDQSEFKVQMQMWTESAQPWHIYVADAPKVARNPG